MPASLPSHVDVKSRSEQAGLTIGEPVDRFGELLEARIPHAPAR